MFGDFMSVTKSTEPIFGSIGEMDNGPHSVFLSSTPSTTQPQCGRLPLGTFAIVTLSKVPPIVNPCAMRSVKHTSREVG